MECGLKRILIMASILVADPFAQSLNANEANFNCVESLSTTQFLTGLGVGTLATVGGMIAGGLVAEAVFQDNPGAFLLMSGLTGSLSGVSGIFGTWKFFCEGNKKNHMTFKISPNTVASQWVFNF
jgi:hypothetical protein